MSKKSIDKNLLFKAVGDIKDEWIEKAVDYKRTNKIISFPFLKYVNMAAALIICIISVAVFVQLKPINELTVPEPNATAITTDKPDATSEANTAMPTEDSVNTVTPLVSDTDMPQNTKRPASVVVVPTKIPVIQTDKPSLRPIIAPTKEPDSSVIIVRTPKPSRSPELEDNEVKPTPTREPDIVTTSPMPTATSGIVTERPIQTSTPDNSTGASEFPEVPLPTNTPMITAIPTDPPRKTPEPVVDQTSAPIPSEPMLQPTLSAIPTYPPSLPPTPDIIAPVPTHITEHNASKYAVEGSFVSVEELNGATEYSGDPNGSVYTFTDENAKNRTGIRIQNPIAGNEEYVHDYGYLRDIKVEGLTNVFDLTGSVLGWGRDEEKLPIPSDQLDLDPYADKDRRVWHIPKEDEIYYSLPRNLKGFSMSFWSKTGKSNDNSAILVFANTNRTVSISINAEAKFTDAMDYYNIFSSSQNINKPNYSAGKWHYYTITFANDWICVYIDGVEVPYDNIVLTNEKISTFNNGFLTRYNAAVTWSEEDYANDWRKYLRIQRGSHDLYQSLTSDEFTVFGNYRYRGLNCPERLMLTFMTGESTEVYLGGAVVEAGTGSAKYSSQSGSQVAQVKYYPDELNWEQVYANYLLAEEPVTE